ncbi:MAG TPA: response regulator [Roseiflexaceae bacterium]|nr:response regulator [Roseiflexaceae bacterium]
MALQKKRPVIVVVDDDVPIVQLIEELLLEEGYEAICCTGDTQAYEAIQAHAPDLIIQDIRIPTAESGLRLLNFIRGNPATQDTPVIICSASAQVIEEYREQIRAWNCQVLAKPFNLNDFVDLVSTLLASSQEQHSA